MFFLSHYNTPLGAKICLFQSSGKTAHVRFETPFPQIGIDSNIPYLKNPKTRDELLCNFATRDNMRMGFLKLSFWGDLIYHNFLSECQRAYLLNVTTKYLCLNLIQTWSLFLSRNMKILCVQSLNCSRITVSFGIMRADKIFWKCFFPWPGFLNLSLT